MASDREVFSLEGKVLKLDTAEDLEPHVEDLIAMDDVEEVRFLGNTLGVGACKRLGEILSTKKNLQVANFADIFTGRLLSEIPEAISALLTSILNLPKLHTVNLNDNAFGLNTVAPLVAFLSAHVPLQHLYLNNNGLGPHAGILIADALSELHAKKEAARASGETEHPIPHLETIICGRNRLENGSMKAWARALGLHRHVREVRMVQNGIRQEGIAHLLNEGLRHAQHLRILDLQDNTFTFLGATALANVVGGWEHIVELGVSDSLLSAKGGIVVAKALAEGKNPHLEILRLQYNDITSVGIRDLAKAVRHALPRLRKMELNGNKFSEDDESIEELRVLFEERKELFAGEIIIEDDWGLDELDELEEESEEEEEVEEEEEHDGSEIPPEELAERLIKDDEEAQEEPVSQRKDKDVDELAEELKKAEL